MAHTAQAGFETIPVSDETTMRLLVARPANATGQLPGIIIFHEAFGLTEHIRKITSQMAELGYLAMAPELFHRTAPGFIGNYNDLSLSQPHIDTLSHEMIEKDIQAVYNWFLKDKQADQKNIASIGFCLGGKFSFIANGIIPLKGAVSFYGSSIPAVLYTYVEKQKSPLLLVWAGKDHHINAIERMDIMQTLHKEEKEYTTLEFSFAEHGFLCNDRESYNARATKESWGIVEPFLSNCMGKA